MRTSIPNFEDGTLNAYTLKPAEVQSGDMVGYKVIAVVRGEFWSAYRGPTGLTDDEIARAGDKVDRAVAEALFPVMRRAGKIYN